MTPDFPLLRNPLAQAIRMLALAAVFSMAGAAQADDYSDINRMVRAGQLNEAMTKVEQYLVTKPRDPQMRFLKGVIQTEQGKPADAVATFTKLTEDYPELPEPYNNLAVLYAGQSQFDKARAALEMAIRTNPSYATAHENLGDVYAKLASQAYSKALQLDSSNTGVQPKLALIRDLFAPNGRGQKPVVAAAPPAAPAVTVAAAKPAPATPAPVAPAVAVAPPPPSNPVTVPPPAPASSAVATPPSGAATAADKDVEAAVRSWAAAWAAKDMAAYLGAYGREFDPPGQMARKDWEAERRKRIEGKARIALKLENLTVSVNGSKAVVKFRQDYRADTLSVSSRKTLELVKAGDRWQIVKESTGS